MLPFCQYCNPLKHFKYVNVRTNPLNWRENIKMGLSMSLVVVTLELTIMAPRAKKANLDESDTHQLRLANVEGKGLGYYDKDSRLIMTSAVSLKLIGT